MIFFAFFMYMHVFDLFFLACYTTCAYKHTFMLIRKYCAYKLCSSTRVHWTICVNALTCSNAYHWLLSVQWTTNMLYVQQPSSRKIYCCTSGIVCEVLQTILLLGLASPECSKYNVFSILCGEKLSFNYYFVQRKTSASCVDKLKRKGSSKGVFFATEKILNKVRERRRRERRKFWVLWVFGCMQVLCFAGLQKVSGLLRLHLNEDQTQGRAKQKLDFHIHERWA